MSIQAHHTCLTPTPPLLSPQLRAIEFCKALVAPECAAAGQRVRLAVARCAGAVAELQAGAKRLHERLEKWAKQRYHDECRAASRAAAALLAAVDGSRAVPASLAVSGVDFSLEALRCGAVAAAAAELAAQCGPGHVARASAVAAALGAVLGQPEVAAGMPAAWRAAGAAELAAAVRGTAASGSAWEASEGADAREDDPLVDWGHLLVRRRTCGVIGTLRMRSHRCRQCRYSFVLPLPLPLRPPM